MVSKPFQLVTKAVLLNEQQEILLIKRAPDSRTEANKWEFPGGKVNPGETFFDALLREVKEETGFVVSITRVLETFQLESQETIYVYLIMESKLISGKMKLSNEHVDCIWIARDKLSMMDFSTKYKTFCLNLSKSPDYVAFKASRLK